MSLAKKTITVKQFLDRWATLQPQFKPAPDAVAAILASDGINYSPAQRTASGQLYHVVIVAHAGTTHQVQLWYDPKVSPGVTGGCTCQKAREYNPYLSQNCPAFQAAYVHYLANHHPAMPFELVLDDEPAREPLTEVELVAQDMVAEFGELGGRVARALALVQADTVEFPHYDTRVELATMQRHCDCQDRSPRVWYGKACKHTLAQYMAAEVENLREAAGLRRLGDSWEAMRQRDQVKAERGQVALEAALKPQQSLRGPANRSGWRARNLGY